MENKIIKAALAVRKALDGVDDKRYILNKVRASLDIESDEEFADDVERELAEKLEARRVIEHREERVVSDIEKLYGRDVAVKLRGMISEGAARDKQATEVNLNG